MYTNAKKLVEQIIQDDTASASEKERKLPKIDYWVQRLDVASQQYPYFEKFLADRHHTQLPTGVSVDQIIELHRRVRIAGQEVADYFRELHDLRAGVYRAIVDAFAKEEDEALHAPVETPMSKKVQELVRNYPLTEQPRVYSRREINEALDKLASDGSINFEVKSRGKKRQSTFYKAVVKATRLVKDLANDTYGARSPHFYREFLEELSDLSVQFSDTLCLISDVATRATAVEVFCRDHNATSYVGIDLQKARRARSAGRGMREALKNFYTLLDGTFEEDLYVRVARFDLQAKNKRRW